jgi:uncharacterized protein (TIGR03435 family)
VDHAQGQGMSERRACRLVNQPRGTQRYAFTLRWDPESGPGGDVSLPGLFTAVQEQLGLKLLPTKGPVEVLSVEHIEMPSPN